MCIHISRKDSKGLGIIHDWYKYYMLYIYIIVHTRPEESGLLHLTYQ